MLRTGEAIITGEAAKLPVRWRITLPEEDKRPSSEDPFVARRWCREREAKDYSAVTAAWRSQNPRWEQE